MTTQQPAAELSHTEQARDEMEWADLAASTSIDTRDAARAVVHALAGVTHALLALNEKTRRTTT